MKTQQPIVSEDEHRVLEFRPRVSARSPGRHDNFHGQTPPPVQPDHIPPEPYDLSRYERSRVEPDDFRQRMLANFAAVAFTIALMTIGLWLAKNIADLRRTQDCLLTGRRDCVRIYVPDP